MRKGWGIYGKRTFTQREAQVVGMVAVGFTTQEIAAKLGITRLVVKNYIRAVYDKTGLDNRVELALWHAVRKQRRA